MKRALLLVVVWLGGCVTVDSAGWDVSDKLSLTSLPLGGSVAPQSSLITPPPLIHPFLGPPSVLAPSSPRFLRARGGNSRL